MTATTKRKPAASRISERDFQRSVIDLARRFGWKVAHFRPAQNARGDWRTPVAADGKGFPDLVMVHQQRGELIFAELKSERGRTTSEQDAWHHALARCGRVHVWRPSDWQDIVTALSFGAL